MALKEPPFTEMVIDQETGQWTIPWYEWFRDIHDYVTTGVYREGVFVANNIISAYNTTTIQDSGKTTPSGDIVGTTDTQTLSNKTLDSSTVIQAVESLVDDQVLVIDSSGNLKYRDDIPTDAEVNERFIQEAQLHEAGTEEGFRFGNFGIGQNVDNCAFFDTNGKLRIGNIASPSSELDIITGELTCGSINRASGTLTLEIGGTAEQSITSTETTFGGNLIIPDAGYIGSTSDTDAIQIEADGDVYFTQKLGVGTTPSEAVHLKSSTSGDPVLMLENTNADNQSAVFQFNKRSASPADNDILGKVQWYGYDDGVPSEILYGQIIAYSRDVSAGTEDAEIRFSVMINGTSRNQFEIGYSEIVGNDSSQDVNTRFESDASTDAFFLDAGNDTITFGAYGAGDLQTDANGLITAVSDDRLKETQRLVSSTLSDVTKLQGVIYKWLPGYGRDTTQEYVGLTAQAVDEIFPELVYKKRVVSYDDIRDESDEQFFHRYAYQEVVDADYWTLNTTGLIPYMIEAFKEVEQRLLTLERKVK